MGVKCNGNCFCDFRNILIDCIENYIFIRIKYFVCIFYIGFKK